MTDPIARIEAALGRLGAEHEPPAGWEARVLAATTSTQAGTAHWKRKRRWWWFALPPVALAASILIVAISPRRGDQPFQLAYDFQTSGTKLRGPSPHLGDVVQATATGGGPHRAVWIYHKDILVAACPGAAQCQSSGASLTAEITLSALGRYTIVALTSKSPVPVPAGTFDTDVASARAAGATTKDEQFDVE